MAGERREKFADSSPLPIGFTSNEGIHSHSKLAVWRASTATKASLHDVSDNSTFVLEVRVQTVPIVIIILQ